MTTSSLKSIGLYLLAAASCLGAVASSTHAAATDPTPEDAACVILVDDDDRAIARVRRETSRVTVTEYLWYYDYVTPAQGDPYYRLVRDAPPDWTCTEVGGTTPKVQTTNTYYLSDATVVYGCADATTITFDQLRSASADEFECVDTPDPAITFGGIGSVTLSVVDGQPNWEAGLGHGLFPNPVPDTEFTVLQGLRTFQVLATVNSGGRSNTIVVLEGYARISPGGCEASCDLAPVTGACEIDGVCCDDDVMESECPGNWTTGGSGCGSADTCDGTVGNYLPGAYGGQGQVDSDGDTTPDGQAGCDGQDEPGDGRPTAYHAEEEMAAQPVEHFSGHKVMTETDISIPLSAGSYSFTRYYRGSAAAVNASSLLGTGWSASAFNFLDVTTPGGGDPVITLYAENLKWTYVKDGTSGKWTGTGPTAQYFEQVIVEDPAPGDSYVEGYAVWRLVNPGQWQIEYFREPNSGEMDEEYTDSDLYGLPFRRYDANGSRQTYFYTVHSNGVPRLDSIRCERFDSVSGWQREASIRFFWEQSALSPNAGKLREIRALRPTTLNGTEDITTHRVRYTYAGDLDYDPDIWDSLGTDGDLVQVEVATRLDDDANDDAVFHTKFTQFRYHVGDSEGTTPDTTVDTNGNGIPGEKGVAGQLRMVFTPANVEYFAEHHGSNDLSLRAAADALLALADDDTAFTGTTVAELASKIVARYDGDRVEVQYLQASCGCLSSSVGRLGIRRIYDYWMDDSTLAASDNFSFWHTEASYDDSIPAWVDYRTYVSHHTRHATTEIPLKIGEAIIEEASPNRAWAKKYIYTIDKAELQAVAHRSAINYSTYDPNIDSTPGLWTLNTLTTSGLVEGYVHDDNSRVTQILVAAGYDDTVAFDAADFDLIEKITYDSTANQEHLVTKRERFRTYTGSTAADDVEVTSYVYGIYTASGAGVDGAFDAIVNPIIAWKKHRVEQEISSENGPGTAGQNQFYDTTYVYDRFGRTILIRAADNSITEYAYDALTGALTSVTQNRQQSDIEFSSTNYLYVGGMTFPSGLTISGWGRSDGGSLTTSFTNDLLGRRLIATGADGVKSYTYRTVAAAPSRLNSNLEYYSSITLPDIIDGPNSEYDGIAMRKWADAAGQSVETTGYVLGATTDTGEDYRTSAATLVASLSAATRSASDFDWSGNAVQQRVWHDASDATAYYETDGFFDEFGRLERITDDNGNHTVYTYDVLDRRTKVRTGIALGNLFDVSEMVYDSGDAGDSNLTLVRQHVTTSSDRETEHKYDDRNRLVWTINELAPHTYNEYDNLNRVIETHASSTAPTAIEAPAQANRIASSYQYYSQRGLVWRSSREIDPTSAPNTDVLVSDQWFDEVGRTIKSQPPGAPGTKIAYDGLGRATHTFMGEMLGDSGYSDVYDTTNRKPKVNGDVILEESVTTYGSDEDQRGFNRVVLSTTYQRAHTSSSTGSLSNYDAGGGDSTAVATFTGYIYDDANRPVQSGYFGTNQSSGFDAGGTAPTMQAGDGSNDFDATNLFTMPSGALVGESIYDERGRVETTVQPDGMRTRTIFDDLNRAIGVIENDQTSSVVTLAWSTNRWATTNAGGGSNPDDQNRVTSFVYDGLGNITRRVAHDGDTNVQETLYTYAYDGTHIKSNALLSKVEYPDEMAGTANTMDDEYEVSYEYNAQGELIEMTDQNNTVHAYAYDAMGRLIEDDVTTFGTNIDQTVHTIEYAFSSTTGLLEEVTSLDGAGTPNTLNQIRFEYDDMLALSKYRQNPSGQVGSGQSADVEYTYTREDGTTNDNFSRLDIMKYPLVNTGGNQRTQLQQHYGAAASLDDKISRSRGFDWDFQMVSVASDEIRYDYVGLGMTVVANHGNSSKLQLDRYVDSNYATYTGSGVTGSRTPGDYEGLDQYGRVERQVWIEKPTVWDPELKPAVVDVKFVYEDDATDILRRYDSRFGTSLADIGDKYDYDGLNRLAEAVRGKPNGTGWTPDGSREEDWGLDVFGNWDTYANAIGGTAFSQNRTHNEANELTLNAETIGSTTTDLDMTYDDAGNLRTREVSDTVRWVYTWDAWNRLVAVDIEEDTGSGWTYDAPRMKSGYYGLNQRAWSQIDAGAGGYANNGTPTEVLDRLEHFYYDASWRLLERRVDTNWPGSGFTHDQTTQWVWGQRYIDELIAWADDTKAASSTFDSTTFVMTDRNFSVIGLNNGERVRYDAYGYALASPFGDVNADGTVDSSDSSIVTGAFGATYGTGSYVVEADVTRDGSVDLADLNAVSGANGDSIDRGDLSESGNIVGYAGYVFEPATGMYVVRHRWYQPETGMWSSRDPIGYVGGGNLYAYVDGSPQKYLDPTGLQPMQPEVDLGGGWTLIPQDLDLEAKKKACLEYLQRCEASGLQAVCRQARKKLENVKQELRERKQEYEEDVFNQPESHPLDWINPRKSRRGHRALIEYYERFRNILAKFIRDFCKKPPRLPPEVKPRVPRLEQPTEWFEKPDSKPAPPIIIVDPNAVKDILKRPLRSPGGNGYHMTPDHVIGGAGVAGTGALIYVVYSANQSGGGGATSLWCKMRAP